MSVLGIDPGKDGGLCSLNRAGQIQCLMVMPTYQTENKGKKKKHIDFIRLLKLITEAEHVVLEKAQPMPSFMKDKFGNISKTAQGNVSAFNYGKDYGGIIGICVATETPYSEVHPATWKATMLKSMPKGKGSAILRAKQLCTNIDLLPTPRCTKPHDGMAEAYLIARYGLQNVVDEF